jgi:hypothetical protein
MKGTKPDLTKLTTKKELTDHDEDKKLSDSFSALLALSTKPDDWRARILAVIPQDMYEDMCEAVSFYTATHLDIVNVNDDKGTYTVRAVGYRNGPAGP